MTRIALLLSLTAILAGCAGTKEIYGPSGDVIHSTKCKIDSANCLQDASDVCKGPYQVLTSSSHYGGLLADALPGPVRWFKMTYQCGRSDGNLPRFNSDGTIGIMPVPISTPGMTTVIPVPLK